MILGFARWTLLALGAAPLAASSAPAYAADHFEGRLRVLVADGSDGHASSWKYSLDQGARTVPLLPTLLGDAGSGDRVTVEGTKEDGRIVGEVQPLTTTAAAPGLGGRKLAVVLFNFASDPRQPWTADQVKQAIFTSPSSTSAFFREESHDQLWLEGKLDAVNGDVFGWYTIPNATSNCSYGVWGAAAEQMAEDDDVDLSGYDHVMYVFPEIDDCGFAGVANLGGGTSWINGELTVRVTAHELGHNMLLHHANSYTCTSGGVPVAIGGSCTSNEYQDRYDVMGAFGQRHNSGWHLQKLGLLTGAQVRTVTEPGTYVIHSALSQPSDAATLRVPRRRAADGSVLDWYYLEVRQQGGVFENLNDFAANGVSIRVNPDPSVLTQSLLIDTTPGSGSGISDAPLAVGRTFTDGQISITTTAAVGGLASVQIGFSGSSGDTRPPTAPGTPRAQLAPGAVNLSWDASTDDVGVTGYAVFRDGVHVGSASVSSFRDAAAVTGPHVYTVYAEDAAGNRSPSSAPVQVTVPAASGPGLDPGKETDTEAPEVSLRPRRTRRGLRFAVVARDRSGVARVELWLDGRRRRTARRSKLTYSWNTRAARTRSHRVLARAVDVAGNRASVAMRVRPRR